ncbi:hypothetical protein CsSME_00047003 [Camellia sinensis var. sinensis]
MLMIQEWWNDWRMSSNNCVRSWRVSNWVRVKQSTIDYVRAHLSEASTLTYLTTNFPVSQDEGHNQACYQPCCALVPSPRGRFVIWVNGKGVPYARAALLPFSRDCRDKLRQQSASVTWALQVMPLQLSCFGSLFPSATPCGGETDNTWNGGDTDITWDGDVETKCLRNLAIASMAAGPILLGNGGAEARYLSNLTATSVPSAA